MRHINEPFENSKPYVAGFNNRKVIVHAASSYDADRAARDFFKPAKSKQWLIWVKLVGEAVNYD